MGFFSNLFGNAQSGQDGSGLPKKSPLVAKLIEKRDFAGLIKAATDSSLRSEAIDAIAVVADAQTILGLIEYTHARGMSELIAVTRSSNAKGLRFQAELDDAWKVADATTAISLEALVKIGSPAATIIAPKMNDSDLGPYVREALTRMGAPAIASVRATCKENDSCRIAALYILYGMNCPEANDAIEMLNFTNDERLEVYERAKKSVSATKARRVLTACLYHQNASIARTAERALEKMNQEV